MENMRIPGRFSMLRHIFLAAVPDAQEAQWAQGFWASPGRLLELYQRQAPRESSVSSRFRGVFESLRARNWTSPGPSGAPSRFRESCMRPRYLLHELSMELPQFKGLSDLRPGCRQLEFAWNPWREVIAQLPMAGACALLGAPA